MAFPFEYRAGLVWVTARVPQSDHPLNFLLDSGAGASVLDLAAARRLGVGLTDRVSVYGVHTQSTGYWSVPLTASVGGVPLRQRFLVVDLEALGRDCRCAVDGLVGADFFRRRVVQLDFDAQQVRLLPAGTASPTSVVLPLRSRRGALVLPIQVNGGRQQWVRLDTGCASALEWVAAGQPPPDAVPRVSIGLAGLTIPTTSTTVAMGPCRFEGVSTGWHETRIFPGEAGLLGNGIWSRFNVTIDAPAGRLILDRRAGR